MSALAELINEAELRRKLNCSSEVFAVFWLQCGKNWFSKGHEVKTDAKTVTHNFCQELELKIPSFTSQRVIN